MHKCINITPWKPVCQSVWKKMEMYTLFGTPCNVCYKFENLQALWYIHDIIHSVMYTDYLQKSWIALSNHIWWPRSYSSCRYFGTLPAVLRVDVHCNGKVWYPKYGFTFTLSCNKSKDKVWHEHLLFVFLIKFDNNFVNIMSALP